MFQVAVDTPRRRRSPGLGYHEDPEMSDIALSLGLHHPYLRGVADYVQSIVLSQLLYENRVSGSHFADFFFFASPVFLSLTEHLVV